MQLLELENITVRFGGLVALNDVSFGFEKGDIVGLVGPNGAGKTTLFDVFSGFARPSRGRLRYKGRDVTRTPVYARTRLGFGRTFQTPQPLHGLTVRENLLVGRRFGRAAGARGDLSELDEILDVVGLRRKACADSVEDLSLSEKKALEVAKALSCQPELLLLDEVLAGMTSEDKREFVKTIRAVHRRFGVSVVMVEHDIETISSFCPRVLVLNFGRLIADGAPADVFSNPEVMRSYTGE